MRKLLERNLLSWGSLLLGCFSLLIAGGLLLSGCGADRAEYRAVVDEVNAKYHQQLNVDFEDMDITPEQLRTHLEAVAQDRLREAPPLDAAV